MTGTAQPPLNFYYIVWSHLLAYRANAVMILKTCEALARVRPHWRIEVLFSEISPESAPLVESLGMNSLPNLRLGTIFPEKMVLTHTITGDVLEDRLSREWQRVAAPSLAHWRKRLARGRNVMMTRNMAVINFFKANFPETPCILELHQLKYDQILIQQSVKTLRAAKHVLREARQRELERIARANHVFCISASLLRRIRQHAPGIEAGLLRSAADMQNAAEENGNAGKRDIELLYTGQLYHWKGVHTIIEALLHLPEHIRLTVIGGNNPTDIYAVQAFARNLGLAGRIDWLGQMSHREVVKYQARARIGLVPLPFQYHISRWFTSPIKVFEMMSAGVALIVSDLPSMHDILQPGVTAEFARPDDPQDWARAIARLMADPKLCERLSAAGQAAARALTFDARAGRIAEAAENVQTQSPITVTR